jgi:hypothetical protein
MEATEHILEKIETRRTLSSSRQEYRQEDMELIFSWFSTKPPTSITTGERGRKPCIKIHPARKYV